MTRNNADFNDLFGHLPITDADRAENERIANRSRVDFNPVEEEKKEKILYHVTDNYKAIDDAGVIKPFHPHPDEEHPEDYKSGIYVDRKPRLNYGSHIYAIYNRFDPQAPDHYEGKYGPEDESNYGGGGFGDLFIPKSVPNSDFKRVGHLFHDDKGIEVHWHPEEHCRGRQMDPATSNADWTSKNPHVIEHY